MHVMVLGAGLSGVTAAWYLAEAGVRVTVVDRQPQAGLETSYANGGQISVSHPEPWSSPAAPLNILRWLGRSDAPMRLRLQMDIAQWRWGLAFLRECLPYRYRRNTRAIAALASYSLTCLQQLREHCDLAYEQQTRGILHLYRHAREWRAAADKRAQLAACGIHGRLCTPAECVEIDPALRHLAAQLQGGFYAPHDESGNARQFTQALAARAAQAGVRFLYGTRIQRLRARGEAIDGVDTLAPDGTAATLDASAYVLCLGSDSAPLMAALRTYMPVYPLKGYSVTIPVIDADGAPTVSLTDESRRIVCSRLGDYLRVAGTAELCGHDLSIDARRCAFLSHWAERAFSGALDSGQAAPWAGLRPATPGNVPLIGRSGYTNLWYNTGHGSLGWTLACGSASSLAKLMTGQKAPVAGFPFMAPVQ